MLAGYKVLSPISSQQGSLLPAAKVLGKASTAALPGITLLQPVGGLQGFSITPGKIHPQRL